MNRFRLQAIYHLALISNVKRHVSSRKLFELDKLLEINWLA